MKIECKRSYIQAFLKDKKIRKSCLDYGLTVDQFNAYPDVDSETKEVVEYVFGEIVQGYLPTIGAYAPPDGFEQYGYYAVLEGINGFYLARFPDTPQEEWEVFVSLQEAEAFLDRGYDEYLNDFEVDKGD